MRKEQIVKYFLFAYVLLLPTNRLLNLPVVGQKIQLPEIVFLLAITYILFSGHWKSFLPGKLVSLDNGVGTLLFAYLLLGLIHNTMTTWLEVIGLFYLAMVCLFFRRAMIHVRGAADLMLKAIRGMGWVAVGSVAFTLVFQWVYPGNTWEMIEPKYIPGWGFAGRVMGFTTSPNMLAGLLGLAIVMEAGRLLFLQERRKKDLLTILAFLLAFLSTFSKSLVLLAAGLLLMVYLKKEFSAFVRKASLVGSTLLVLVFLLSTHWLKLPQDPSSVARTVEQSYATEKVVAFGPVLFMATMHRELKRQAWAAFWGSPVFGLGPGMFQNWLARRQEEGLYPAGKPVYDPHSLYTGMLAEGGLVGALGLAVFLGSVVWIVLKGRDPARDALKAGVVVGIVLLLAEGWAADVLNFRQLWVWAGIMGSYQKPFIFERKLP